MPQLCEAIRQKRTELWKNQSWILHHDNASAHTSRLVREFLPKNKFVIIPQPPYSPSLASANFFLSLKLKTPMKGRRFARLEEIKENSKQMVLANQKERFKSVSRIGKNAGISVLYLRGVTLKGTRWLLIN